LVVAEKGMAMAERPPSPAVDIGRGLEDVGQLGETILRARSGARTGKNHHPVRAAEPGDDLLETV
jgi:hypothetical protein